MNHQAALQITDLHNHLVPGVDDGARTLEEALESLERLRQEGIGALVTTPHLDGSLTLSEEGFQKRMKEVDTAWLDLKAAADRSYPEMVLLRGHEVMLDVPHPDLSDPRTRLGGGPFVLVEWPGLRVPPGAEQVLERLREEGYRLILAHPERYHGLDERLSMPGRWRESGALLQMNYGSLVGRYGDAARRKALTLLERGWVDLFSTDFHGRSHLSIYLRAVQEAMEEFEALGQFHLLAHTNPARILQGKEPEPVPPLQVKRSLWDKVREIFQGSTHW